MTVLVIFTVVFLVLIALSVPIGFSLGAATLLGFILSDAPLDLFAQRLWTGLDSFSLIAIPFFVLAGELMGGSGILQRLLDFSKLILGRIKGSLLYINILISMLFGGINGSAIADTSAVGSMLIPATKKEYKEGELAAAVTATSSVVGPIIPPSLPMLIYAFAAANVSVAGLFLAGIVPGIILGLSLMIVTYILVRKKDYPKDTTKYTFKNVLRILRRFLIAVILPIIIVVGITAGIVTPTEAGCLGIIYALIIGFFVTKELTFKTLINSIYRTVIVTAIVMILISIGNVMTWWISIHGIPGMVSELFQILTDSAAVFLILMLILYLFVGLFIEQAAAMIMLVPIFAPLAVSYGIDPIHFGLFTVMALGFGLVTPPVGLCLFISGSIANIPVHRVFAVSAPYLFAMLIVLIIVTLFPPVYMWVPRMFGF